MVRIYYSTVYGSTREYAEELASLLDDTAQPIPSTSPSIDGPVVVLSPIHGPSHAGAKFVKSLPADVPVALVTVCMSTAAPETDPAAGLLGKRADSVTRFYLPGRMNYSGLSLKHKMVMRGLVTALKAKGNLSASEQDTVDMHGKDTDRVDYAALDPVVAWVRRRANA
ncbi:flavodoxin domain-containing protein [Corynebacterium coyleae]|uniref:flavodoxin domain-containing protein n=1 Tax=Corynebacterium coyleae TaxID=53374 RepID=UPI001CC9E871|nr:flavodoxin domain-containing protein [Corynebacterium coyleae]UBI09308.1 flavodoxin domain-containing protein [Corynebacterium coyleae]